MPGKTGLSKEESPERLPYEPPMVMAIGNLNTVVALTSQSLTCDGTEVGGGDGDHNPNPVC